MHLFDPPLWPLVCARLAKLSGVTQHHAVLALPTPGPHRMVPAWNRTEQGPEIMVTLPPLQDYTAEQATSNWANPVLCRDVPVLPFLFLMPHGPKIDQSKRIYRMLSGWWRLIMELHWHFKSNPSVPTVGKLRQRSPIAVYEWGHVRLDLLRPIYNEICPPGHWRKFIEASSSKNSKLTV